MKEKVKTKNQKIENYINKFKNLEKIKCYVATKDNKKYLKIKWNSNIKKPKKNIANNFKKFKRKKTWKENSKFKNNINHSLVIKKKVSKTVNIKKTCTILKNKVKKTDSNINLINNNNQIESVFFNKNLFNKQINNNIETNQEEFKLFFERVKNGLNLNHKIENFKSIHHIKKKQSQANLILKRNYGISYIQNQDLFQKDKSIIYKLLPKISIQLSKNLMKYDKSCSLYKNCLNNCKFIFYDEIINCYYKKIKNEEDNFKEIIYDKNSKINIKWKFSNSIKLFNNNANMIFYMVFENNIWKPLKDQSKALNQENIIKIWVNCKNGVSSKMSYLKILKLNPDYESNNEIINFDTNKIDYIKKMFDNKNKNNFKSLGIKIEFFVYLNYWNKLKYKEKEYLYNCLSNFKKILDNEMFLFNFNNYRVKNFDTNNIQILKSIKINYRNPKTLLMNVKSRDCFLFNIIKKTEIINNIKINKFYFDKNDLPSNFNHFLSLFPDFFTGITTYEDVFNNEELNEIENNIFNLEKSYLENGLLGSTGQTTFFNSNIKRTKFFFGARYLWNSDDISKPESKIAAGVRTDVSDWPRWIEMLIHHKLVSKNIIPKDFVNSIALNVYHDGKEGLGQHFDDNLRFKQPIYSLRVFSDCRLSFGCQYFSFCNGAFTIPLSRGCICVMEENSYASNGIKHCIRPIDMTGKSAAFILRQIHKDILEDANEYNYKVDLPLHFQNYTLK